jgi:hypothetical protein
MNRKKKTLRRPVGQLKQYTMLGTFMLIFFLCKLVMSAGVYNSLFVELEG